MPVHPAVAAARARLGGLMSARDGADPDELAAARAELAAAKTYAAIDQAVDALIAVAPPLTAGQRARLATLLNDAPETAVS